MAEPNHELTDSEAQAFQPEPHLQDLFKRLKPASQPAPPASGVPAHRPDAVRERPEGEPSPTPDRSSRRNLR